ncbi:MAG: TetR/AcrR family transcriptional regulator [Candidatus Acidiferrales bacterium]
MQKRAELTEDRKNEILDAALEVFAEMGLGDASVDDVVRRSGLSKGTLYWYFQSKDRLIGALMKRFFAHELNKLAALQKGPGTVRERLLRYSRDVVKVVKGTPRALTLEFYAVAVRQKWVRKFLGELYERYCAELAAVIREGAEKGEFRAVNAEQAAAAITGLCEGLILLWALSPDVFPFEKYFEASLRTLLDGMKPESRQGT